jgi:hypothetical protein
MEKKYKPSHTCADVMIDWCQLLQPLGKLMYASLCSTYVQARGYDQKAELSFRTGWVPRDEILKKGNCLDYLLVQWYDLIYRDCTIVPMNAKISPPHTNALARLANVLIFYTIGTCY